MKADLPRSVRYDKDVDQRLAAFMRKPGVSFPDVMNLAMRELFRRLDAGWRIEISEKDGVRLVPPETPTRRQSK